MGDYDTRRFMYSNGVLYERNFLLDSWFEADLEKICDTLNRVDEMCDNFTNNMYLEKKNIKR